MLLSLLYLALGQILRLLTVGGDRDRAARDAEILVLRHQLCVLLAAAAGLLPGTHWPSFPVSPQTVLRWHRALVKGRWT
jgi:putative transposase